MKITKVGTQIMGLKLPDLLTMFVSKAAEAAINDGLNLQQDITILSAPMYVTTTGG